MNFLRYRLHCRGRRANQMVRPDHRADAGFAEHFGRRAVVLGRHDDERPAARPLTRELQNFVGTRELAVNQDRVCAGTAIGFRATQRLVHAPACDQRFHARHNRKILVRLRVLAGLDLAAEFVHIGKRLRFAVNEAIRFRELLVLDTYAGNAALFELAHEAAHVVEVAVAGIAVQQNRQIACVGHEFEVVDHLRPACFVVVAHAELRGNREARAPDRLEAGFAHDAGGQAVMGLHHEFEFVADKHLAQTCATGSGDEGGFAGIHFLYSLWRAYWRSFCPACDWKMATITEFSFIGHLDAYAFPALPLSGKMCRFLQ